MTIAALVAHEHWPNMAMVSSSVTKVCGVHWDKSQFSARPVKYPATSSLLMRSSAKASPGLSSPTVRRQTLSLNMLSQQSASLPLLSAHPL